MEAIGNENHPLLHRFPEGILLAVCRGRIFKAPPGLREGHGGDLATKEGLSPKEEAEIKEKEGTRVLQKIKSGDYVIAMDLNQKEFDSISFSSYLENAFVKGRSSLIFLIGGSLGLSDALKARANDSISFGKMTFPHQLSRIMLLEQLYRAFRIAHHEPYHK